MNISRLARSSYSSERIFSRKRFFHANVAKIRVLQPGLVVVKKALNPETQVELVNAALKIGAEKEGFWKTNEYGQIALNQTPHRGRIFNSVDKFPEIISKACKEKINLAAQIDPTIKKCYPTHLILLFYKTLQIAPKEGYIPWHQDKDPNDGEENFPVISFTFGDSCNFYVCNQKPKINSKNGISSPENLDHDILLESGDVLFFGGPSRKIYHSIYKIHQNSSPDFLSSILKDARLNFTFRYSPKIIGQEDSFSSKNFKSVYSQTSMYTQTT
jgi:hypothetical protein